MEEPHENIIIEYVGCNISPLVSPEMNLHFKASRLALWTAKNYYVFSFCTFTYVVELLVSNIFCVQRSWDHVFLTSRV